MVFLLVSQWDSLFGQSARYRPYIKFSLERRNSGTEFDEVDGSDTLTQVSELTCDDEFVSTETLQSVSTITGDVTDIANKSHETEEAFSATEKILQNMTDDALKCLQTGREKWHRSGKCGISVVSSMD